MKYNTQMPINANKVAYKEKEFQTYVLWKSLPAYFRGMKKEQLVSYGFTDPLIIKIAKIKNQTAFAKKFNIKDLGTLTDWNSKIKENKLETNTADVVFKKQVTNMRNVLEAEPDKRLEKKIHDQNKLIMSLRKENNLLKKQLSVRPIEKPKKVATVPPPPLPSPSPVSPPVPAPVQTPPTQIMPPSEPPRKQSFLEKLKNAVTKWKV